MVVKLDTLNLEGGDIIPKGREVGHGNWIGDLGLGLGLVAVGNDRFEFGNGGVETTTTIGVNCRNFASLFDCSGSDRDLGVEGGWGRAIDDEDGEGGGVIFIVIGEFMPSRGKIEIENHKDRYDPNLIYVKSDYVAYHYHVNPHGVKLISERHN
ncbi:cytochrome c biogenesis ATP-binding exportprotein CcmA [Striga asiatica]|uniref:Cytochrome c biogenesis ATP-binding exportprotein CcmA n=1 Tax=Striga asiatica TaxID=4170 RepID=A0A5A7QDK0_STRAF|nr:cytochrome c biogenesis ATP-binding exportprotein CcmA [Striga asiatica]